MRDVDKVLVARSFGAMQAWAAELAEQVAREFEMGLDFDFASVGESRRKMLRMELVKLGYSVVAGKMVRLKSGRFVA